MKYTLLILHVDYNKGYADKIVKNKPLQNFKRGRAPGALVLDPPLIFYIDNPY